MLEQVRQWQEKDVCSMVKSGIIFLSVDYYYYWPSIKLKKFWTQIKQISSIDSKSTSLLRALPYLVSYLLTKEAILM